MITGWSIDVSDAEEKTPTRHVETNSLTRYLGTQYPREVVENPVPEAPVTQVDRCFLNFAGRSEKVHKTTTYF